MDDNLIAIVAVSLFGSAAVLKVVFEGFTKPKIARLELEKQYLQRMLDELSEVRQRLESLEEAKSLAASPHA